METKDIIIRNFAKSLVDAANAVFLKTTTLNDNFDENSAIIETVNVLLESVRSQTVLIQSSIDEYK